MHGGEHICAYLWITSDANGKNCLKIRVRHRRVAYARPLHVGGGLRTPSLYVGVVVGEPLLLVARLLGTATRGKCPYRVGANDVSSAFDDVHGQAARRRFLVLRQHVVAGLAHRFNDGIQRHRMPTITPEGHTCRVNRLHRGDRIAFDAGDLNQASNRVAGQPQ